MADRYTVDGCAILDSGFHIGDFISPQHAQSIAAAMNAPPAAVPEPEGEVLTNLWTDEQCLEFCRAAFRHRHQPGLPTQTTLDDIRYGAYFATLAAARKGE